MTARGVRLNNPGNIRISSAQWQGKITPSRDADFETFDNAVNGIRALAVILLSYFLNHDLDTLGRIISRWAPPRENDTQAYIDAVSRSTGLPDEQELDLTVLDVLASVTEGIIYHENGSFPYTMETVDEACTAALKSKGVL